MFKRVLCSGAFRNAALASCLLAITTTAIAHKAASAEDRSSHPSNFDQLFAPIENRGKPSNTTMPSADAIEVFLKSDKAFPSRIQTKTPDNTGADIEKFLSPAP